MEKVIPLYARGVDREKAERIATMFMQSYQPPIQCGHKPGRRFYKLEGVRGKFQACTKCGMVVGVLK